MQLVQAGLQIGETERRALLSLLWWAIIISAVLSWLVAFDIINLRNDAVRQISIFLERVTDPVLRPFRRIIPPLGGVDIIAVHSLAGTDVTQVNLDLSASAGGGDGALDTVSVDGTNGNDAILVAGDATAAAVLGLSAQVSVTDESDYAASFVVVEQKEKNHE